MGEKLPVVTGDQLIRALKRAGFAVARVRGSHHFLRNAEGRRTSVPVHAGAAVKPGILKQILKDARMTANELRDLL